MISSDHGIPFINVKCNIRYILSNILFKTQEHSEKVKTKFSDFHKLITDTESGVFTIVMS